jgi:uncharacterized protein
VDEHLTAFVPSSGSVYGEAQGMKMDNETRTSLEAAAFRRLVAHLRSRPDAQNIDMMNLAGFCRNCLSNWMQDEAKSLGIELSKDEARKEIYGMPYDDWRALHQKEASADQKAKFAAQAAKPDH